MSAWSTIDDFGDRLEVNGPFDGLTYVTIRDSIGDEKIVELNPAQREALAGHLASAGA